MSFLAGRLAGKEGAYFFQESKHAVNRLVEKSPAATTTTKPIAATLAPPPSVPQSDVLPEVLRHSLPSGIFGKPSDSSTLSNGSKWVIPSDPKNGSGVSPDKLNPLRAYVSLPQVTFGPKRWELPYQEHSMTASTANELRKDKYTPMNPEKLKAAAEGLANIGKAFAVATALVFGGSAVLFGLAVSKLELQNGDDIRIKGKDMVQPKFDVIREQLMPFKAWAEEKSKKWQLDRHEEIKEKPMITALSKILGATKTP
ncbi:unnamed protein product [Linum trigynum]|uniref:Uncharacterized protein n=1 Tax=Linum trigynum TaxID=586398 RepID=A0AAV2G912_9ROSI